MNFHTFGNPANPRIILIHGTLTPWQIWGEQLEHFSEKYHVTAIALDAHEEDKATELTSIQQQAEQIENYITDNYDGEVFALCGISMGGAIAGIIWQNGIVGIKNLIMDSAPILPMGKIPAMVMTNNYLSIIRKSKKRDPKTIENFKKHFLPEKYLDTFLKIADNMSEESVRNMIASVCKFRLSAYIPESETRVLYMHGTKGTEFFQKRCGAFLKKHYPKSEIYCFSGCGHCEAAIYEPEFWALRVEEFMEE